MQKAMRCVLSCTQETVEDRLFTEGAGGDVLLVVHGRCGDISAHTIRQLLSLTFYMMDPQ